MNFFKKILLSIAILAMPLSASAQIAANNCPLGKWAMGIGSTGSLLCSYLSDNDIPNNITIVTDQQMVVSKNPATTASASASLRINPLSAPATSKLMAIQDNGTDRFTVTKEGNATLSGDLNVAGTISGVVSGSFTHALTADALTNNPADCSVHQFANAIAATGDLTCAALTDADVPDTITVNLASTATALASAPSLCSPGNFTRGIDVNGNAQGCTSAGTGSVTSVGSSTGLTGGPVTSTGSLSFDYSATLAGNPALTAGQAEFDSTDAQGGVIFEGATANNFETLLTVAEPTADRTITFPNETGTVALTVDNVATATALAANGSNCSAGNFAQGVDASGAAEGCATAVTSVATGTGMTGGTITGTGTVSWDYSKTLASNNLTAGQIEADSGDSQGGLLFEGATANTNQTLLTVIEPTADRTLSLPNETGTLATVNDNVATATALASAPTTCSVGQFARGVDVNGNAVGCTSTNTGNVSSVATGTGLTGGPITTTGTVSIDYSHTLASNTLGAGNVLMDSGEAGILFEGATSDTAQTLLTVTDPTADRTITLPNQTGTVITSGDNAGRTIDNAIIGSSTPLAATHTSITSESGNNFSMYSDSGTANLIAQINGSTGQIIGAPLIPGTFVNLKAVNATTTNTNDSLKLQCGAATCSATNPGYVIFNDPTSLGAPKIIKITADVTVKISGAVWGFDTFGDLTKEVLRYGIDDDNGTARFCVALLGGRKTLLTTDTTATQASVSAPESVLCDVAVGSATNQFQEMGWVRANFTDSTNVWAVQTGQGDINFGSADGYWSPFNPNIVGCTGAPTTVYSRWTQNGRNITIAIRQTAACTASGTVENFTAPAKDAFQMAGVALAGQDNSVALTGPELVQSGSAGTATISVLKDGSGAAWTNGGNRAMGALTITYEAGPVASFLE